MVEEYIQGHVYRIFVFNDKIIDVVQRERPFVIGNGNTNLSDLINQRNQKLIQDKLFPTKNISTNLIQKQGYNMNSIIKNNQTVYISDVIKMHNGAILKRIDIHSIPKENLDLFVNVAKILKINCCGIDYISKDITTDFNKNKNVILEVNGTPDTEIHTKLNNYGNNFFENVVNNIF